VTQLPDTTPPVIAAAADISVEATSSDSTYAVVTYDTPTATDDKDGTDPVSCAPASGSNFNIGTTTVTCTASDEASNMSTTTFNVGVTDPAPLGPTPGSTFVMASQPDQSYLCTPDWRTCYTSGGPQYVVPLGLGAQYTGDTITGITIAKQDDYDDAPQGSADSYNNAAYPWTIRILCFDDAGYTSPCATDPLVLSQTTQTTDNIHWTAPFNLAIDPTKYYEFSINDNINPLSVYGTTTEPYWVLSGVAQ
jgi:hypothetical protein